MSNITLVEDSSKATSKVKEESKKDIINKEKEIYFSILYQMKEKEKDFIFTKYESKPQEIYSKDIIGQNGIYLYEKVFKMKKKIKKEEKKKGEDNKKKEDIKKEDKKKEDKNKLEEIEIQFEIGKDNYIITFNDENQIFYFDIELKKGNKYLKNIAKDNIDQNMLDYFQKLELFLAALKNNKEEEKIENLYEEIIKLYSKKKGFYLLISLFVNIYENHKNLCQKLIEEFNKINKEKKNEKNMDRKKELDSYVSIFSTISSKADDIIKNNGYDPIQFYGIIFSYLNFYDYENFKKYFEKLYKEKCETLYEILLIYYSNFLNPINQDLTFFENFIEYTIKNKEFNIFENSLNYILYIETFIIVIDKKREKIDEKYNKEFKTIKIKADLKIIKKEKGAEIKNIIKSIQSIINFSKEKQKLLIYLNSDFWINILKHYYEPDALNIDICFELRELLKNYYGLIKIIFKEEKNDDEKKKKMILKNILIKMNMLLF